METIDITPDPRILIALTHTPMQPLDALCELVDNALDSFHTARLQGQAVDNPFVVIDLPSRADLTRDASLLRVRDNGPGLDLEMLQNSLRAGYSSQNPHDTLGLFGMGFNISTGKLGRVTRLSTAQADSNQGLEVTVDLDKISEQRTFQVPIKRFQKPSDFGHGTVVEVASWWPEGNPNSGFVGKLIQYGVPTVRRELGRRYAAFLREGAARLVVNGEECEAFEHCVWGDQRYVTKRGHGQIPAVLRFDELTGSQVRCMVCRALAPPSVTSCPACASSSLRTIEKRITGWIGIQRFDDKERFGIDLIRNGRAIRIAEKAAFFEFTDEFKRTTVDYPIDNPYGRIIGEVRLDHVPVDFLKQDFQRSSPEWQEAMAYLRGTTPLQPGMLHPGEENMSPTFLLYQGYRRVRTPGRTDMYMGYWDADEKKPKRISREEEARMFEGFVNKEPGLLDDTEWWRKVEEADTPPVAGLVECPQCGSENLEGHETCLSCGFVLEGKNCINPDCKQLIPLSAVSCPNCGQSQLPVIVEPWTCAVCGHTNIPESNACSECTSARDATDPLSREHLLAHSNKADELSLPGLSVRLADDSSSSPIDVNVLVTQGPIQSPVATDPVASIAFKGDSIDIFLDKSHSSFRALRLRPEHVVAIEAATYLFEVNRNLSGEQHRTRHSVPALTMMILKDRWGDTLSETPERLREDIQGFFGLVQDRLGLTLGPDARDVYDELSDESKKRLVENLMGHGLDVGELDTMVTSGAYIRFLDPQAFTGIFIRRPETFFDGIIWRETYGGISGLPAELIRDAQQRLLQTYSSCLEDIARYMTYPEPEAVTVQRARASLDFLLQKVT